MSTQNEIRQQITQKIVDALKAGTPPWRRPWRNDFTNTGTAANAVSGKAYRGINVLLLGLAGYASKWWATFAQIQTLDARVKKGERATRIVYWRQVEKVTANRDGHELVETFPLLRTYCVFNVEQCEGNGIEKYLAHPCTATIFVDYEPAERVIRATNARIEYGGNKAAYCPDEDYILLPPKSVFMSEHEFYGTAYHELVHWTGHQGRLDRLVKNARFRGHAYAVEELVGEVGGCFLCNELSIHQATNLDNHAAYLASWLAVLQADASAIFTAASQANQATDYILAFSRNHKATEASDENETVLAEAVGLAEEPSRQNA